MNSLDSSVYEQYKKWEGPVSKQEVQKADRLLDKATGNEGDIYRDIGAVGFFQEDHKSVLNQINAKMNQLDKQSSYEYRSLKLQQTMLQKINFQKFYYQWPVEQMQDYINTYGVIFMGALILVGLSSIFTREKASGVESYILSSKNGRKKMVHAKLIAAFVFVLTAALLSIGFDVLYWMFRAGNYGWHANIHSIPKYYSSPYDMDMLAFFLLKSGIHVFAGLTLAVFTLFVSSLSKNSFISFLSSGFVFAFPFMAGRFVIIPAWLQKLFQLSYATAMRVDDWFTEFQTFNFFGYPILYFIASFFCLLVFTAFFLIFLYKIMERKQVS